MVRRRLIVWHSKRMLVPLIIIWWDRDVFGLPPSAAGVPRKRTMKVSDGSGGSVTITEALRGPFGPALLGQLAQGGGSNGLRRAMRRVLGAGSRDQFVCDDWLGRVVADAAAMVRTVDLAARSRALWQVFSRKMISGGRHDYSYHCRGIDGAPAEHCRARVRSAPGVAGAPRRPRQGRWR